MVLGNTGLFGVFCGVGAVVVAAGCGGASKPETMNSSEGEMPCAVASSAVL